MIVIVCYDGIFREEVPAEPRRVVVTLDSFDAPTVLDAFPRCVQGRIQGLGSEDLVERWEFAG